MVKNDYNIATEIKGIRETIEKANLEFKNGNLERTRELCDNITQNLIEFKDNITNLEYENFHTQVALLRIKANQSPNSRTSYIETELFPLIWNDRVEKWIDYYTNRGGEYFKLWQKRSQKYIGEVKKILTDYELPRDLAYVPIVESGYFPFARSPVGAVGMWQFMEATAREKGLKINYWIDERRDPYKSTRAAARFLKDLYQQFGNWEMALAGYNYGPNGVRRRINKWQTDDYWELFLPRETENFVPRIMAVMFILKEPELFGMEPLKEKTYSWREFKVKNSVDLRDIAELCDLEVQKIQLLNPEIKQMCTPPDTEYNIRIPAEKYEKLSSVFSKDMYLTKQEINRRTRRVVYYEVKRGDSLWSISQKFNVSANQIKKWNNMVSNTIHPRDSLKIHRHGL